jgi:hypothetical protein
MEKQTRDLTLEKVDASVEQLDYEAPRVTVMDEAEVLKAFQFTSAAITWWVM